MAKEKALPSKLAALRKEKRKAEPISREALMKTIENLTEENVRLHRLIVNWRGGLRTASIIDAILNCEAGEGIPAERQSGKTTALLTIVHNRHKGRAIVVAMSAMQGGYIRDLYKKMYPDDTQPQVVAAFQAINAYRGNKLPVYCDEWWMYTEQQMRTLKEDIGDRLAGVVGTIPIAVKVRL